MPVLLERRNSHSSNSLSCFIKKYIFLEQIQFLHTLQDSSWYFIRTIMFSFCLFSSVDGCVTSHGTPVVWATLTRFRQSAWFDADGEKSDTTVTETHGNFHFDAIFPPFWLGRILAFLPHEPVISQKIVVLVDGKEYILWQHSKHNYNNNWELALLDKETFLYVQRPIQLSCALEHPEKRHEPYEVYGIGEIVPLESSSNNPLFPTVLV